MKLYTMHLVPALPASPLPNAEFKEFVDLGIITVPEGYVQDTCFKDFIDEYHIKKSSFYFYDRNINDQNFRHPTLAMKAGKSFQVVAYKKVTPGEVTSKECLDFLRGEKSLLFGAQGLTHVFSQKREKLPKGCIYLSFDKRVRLWQDPDGKIGVPGLILPAICGYGIGLNDFDKSFNKRNNAILSFRKR
jgi:hypothetical protein